MPLKPTPKPKRKAGPPAERHVITNPESSLDKLLNPELSKAKAPVSNNDGSLRTLLKKKPTK